MRALKAYNFFRLNFLSLLLILFYFSEGYNKFSYLFLGERSYVVKSIKLIVIIYISLNLVKKNNVLLNVLVLIGCFCLGQLSITPNFDYTILSNVFKYIFPLLLFAYINNNKLNFETKLFLQKVFEHLIFFNSILIILGFIFDINIFRTYLGSRFGYNGLLVSSGTSSYVILITLFHFLFKKGNSFIFDYKVLIIIISSLLIGTKSIYLGVGLILTLYFILYTKKKYRVIGVIIMILIMLFSLYYITHSLGKFHIIWENDGILTSILSYRDILFKNYTLPFISDNWTFTNYLFGGINDITTRSQMGFIDLFYFFGIVGSIYYLYLYYTNYIKYKITKESLLFLSFISIIIAITGNFFLNSSVVVYMLIIREINLNTIRFNSTSN